MVLSSDFLSALEADRGELNQRFKLCSSQGTPLDAAAFKAHLLERVQPIVVAVAERFPERARQTTKELFMVSLELFRASYWGTESRLDQLNQLWEHVLPKLPHLIAREPERVSGSISNALINLCKYPVRIQPWLDNLAHIGPDCQSVGELLQLGQVLAWQAGMSLLRPSAIAALSSLPRPLAGRALGLTQQHNDSAWQEIIQRLTTDRWYQPLTSKQAGTGPVIHEAFRVGNYLGLGGGFSDTPRVFSSDDQLFVTDQTSVWRIEVDRFGCLLQPVAGAAIKSTTKKSPSPHVDVHGKIAWGKAQQKFDYLARATSEATDGQTLAVTLETSFHVYLFAKSATA